ncbi:MAG: YqgE/AlgH family protein [Pseudomonadota bacterium]
MSEFQSLANQFLIAMPALDDPNFERAVTLICEHTEQGALGLIINKATSLNLRQVFEQLELPGEDDDVGHVLPDQPVMHGGPVATSRGFVLHEGAGKNTEWNSSLPLGEGLRLTTSRDIMEAMAQGDGPPNALFALGYAGWTAGQLESEMADNAWLSVERSNDLIFHTPIDERWDAATRLLGIDPSRLSSVAGHS